MTNFAIPLCPGCQTYPLPNNGARCRYCVAQAEADRWHHVADTLAVFLFGNEPYEPEDLVKAVQCLAGCDPTGAPVTDAACLRRNIARMTSAKNVADNLRPNMSEDRIQRPGVDEGRSAAEKKREEQYVSLLNENKLLLKERDALVEQNAALQEERESAYANSKSASQDLCDLSTENRRLQDLLRSERKHREDWSKVIPESDLGLVLELCKRKELFDQLREAMSAPGAPRVAP